MQTSFLRAENTVVHKKKEMRGWIKLQNEELRDQYSPVNSVTVIKPRKTRWLRKVAMVATLRNAHKILTGKPEVLNDSLKLGDNTIGWVLLDRAKYWLFLMNPTGTRFRLCLTEDGGRKSFRSCLCQHVKHVLDKVQRPTQY